LDNHHSEENDDHRGRTALRRSRCLDFALAADLIESDRINVFERWESAAHLASFRGAGPTSEQRSVIRSADVSEYEIDAPDERA